MLISLEINRYNEIIALVKKTDGKIEGKIVERNEKFGYYAEDLCNVHGFFEVQVSPPRHFFVFFAEQRNAKSTPEILF